jgi:hypothetical protein
MQIQGGDGRFTSIAKEIQMFSERDPFSCMYMYILRLALSGWGSVAIAVLSLINPQTSSPCCTVVIPQD